MNLTPFTSTSGGSSLSCAGCLSARRAFVLLHVPFVTVLLWLAAYPDTEVRYWTMLGLDVFMVIHAGLHWRLSGHPKYEFGTPHSRFIVYGTATLAAVHLLVLTLGSA